MKVADSTLALKLVNPSSCSQSVRKAIAFHGIVPTTPCGTGMLSFCHSHDALGM